MGLLPSTRIYLSSQAAGSWSRHQGHKSAGCSSVQHSHHRWDRRRQARHGLMGAQCQQRVMNGLSGKAGRILEEYPSPPGHLESVSSTTERPGTSEGPTYTPDDAGTPQASLKVFRTSFPLQWGN